MPVLPLFSMIQVIVLGILTGRVQRSVNERKDSEERNLGYCEDQRSIVPPFAEPPQHQTI